MRVFMVSLLANVHVFLLLINFLPSIGKKSYEIIENRDIMYDNDITGYISRSTCGISGYQFITYRLTLSTTVFICNVVIFWIKPYDYDTLSQYDNPRCDDI